MPVFCWFRAGLPGFHDVAVKLPDPLDALRMASGSLRHPRSWAGCGHPAAQRFSRVGFTLPQIYTLIHALHDHALRFDIAGHRRADNTDANAGKNPLWPPGRAGHTSLFSWPAGSSPPGVPGSTWSRHGQCQGRCTTGDSPAGAAARLLLAIQNAFRLVLFVMISSIIAACFISTRKYTSPIPPLTRQAEVPHRERW